MTALNKFLPFATGASPNVITDAVYAALAARDTGFQSGVASSEQLNKVWRQGSLMAAVMGQIIANNGVDAKDSDSVATLVANLLAGIYANPALTGTATAPTVGTSDSSTKIGTTEFVWNAIAAALTAYATKASPTFTGDPKAPTAPQFDNDTSLATTAFVQRALGNAAGLATYVANGAISATDMGKIIFVPLGTASITLAFPTGVPAGSQVRVYNNTTASTVTLTSTGSITSGGYAGTTLKVNADECVDFYTDGLNNWVAVQGDLGNARAFAHSIDINGYQQLPGGLMLQWGKTALIGSMDTLTVTLPVSFPNATLNVQATRITTNNFSGDKRDSYATFAYTPSTFNLYNQYETISCAYVWFAIGY